MSLAGLGIRLLQGTWLLSPAPVGQASHPSPQQLLAGLGEASEVTCWAQESSPRHSLLGVSLPHTLSGAMPGASLRPCSSSLPPLHPPFYFSWSFVTGSACLRLPVSLSPLTGCLWLLWVCAFSFLLLPSLPHLPPALSVSSHQPLPLLLCLSPCLRRAGDPRAVQPHLL